MSLTSLTPLKNAQRVARNQVSNQVTKPSTPHPNTKTSCRDQISKPKHTSSSSPETNKINRQDRVPNSTQTSSNPPCSTSPRRRPPSGCPPSFRRAPPARSHTWCTAPTAPSQRRGLRHLHRLCRAGLGLCRSRCPRGGAAVRPAACSSGGAGFPALEGDGWAVIFLILCKPFTI